MPLIKCKKCGATVDDSCSIYCNRCGNKIVNYTKNSWVKMRKAFGIADLVIGVIFLILIISSEGGIQNNSRMMTTSWFFVWCGMLQILGRHKKGFTIASIVFYSMGIIFNFFCSLYYPAHLYIVIMMAVFLVLTSVSLSKKKSFYK